jgi:hypothetical protein
MARLKKAIRLRDKKSKTMVTALPQKLKLTCHLHKGAALLLPVMEKLISKESSPGEALTTNGT